MDIAASDALIGELLVLTRRLRGQLARHAALGTWAAPGGASTRMSGADGEGEPEDGAALGGPSEMLSGVPDQAAGLAAAHGATAIAARHPADAIAGDPI